MIGKSRILFVVVVCLLLVFDFADNTALAQQKGELKSDGGWVVFGTDMYSNVTGKIGIGTSSPDKKLTVNGDVKVEGKLLPEGGIITTSNITIESQGENIRIIAGGSRINIDPTGRISIQGGRDINIVSGNNLNITTGKNMNFKVGGSLDLEVGKNLSVKAGEDMIVQAGKNTNIQAGESMNILAGKNIEVAAPKNVIVQTSGAKLHMEKGNIDMQGKDISVRASGSIRHQAALP